MEAQKSNKSKNRRKYRALPINILMSIAWANIRRKKLRSFLTLAGVSVGVGAIFFLLSFGLGLQKLVSDQIIGDESIRAVEVTSPNSRIIKLNEKVVNNIKTFPHADRVGSQYSFASSIGYKGGDVGSIVFGVDKQYLDMQHLQLTAGRLLNESDNKTALINMGALKAIGISNPSDAIGKNLNVNVPLNNVEAKRKPVKENYEIVGIVDSQSAIELYVPGNVFSLAGVENYSQVKIIADDTKNVVQLRKQIEALGFETTSPVDTLDQINNIFKFFNIMLATFGAIGMIVAVLGMFNTLTISLLERTPEIGLMIALGGRNSDMSKLFIIEATQLAFYGAVMGILLASIGGFVVNIILNNFAHRRGVTGQFSIFVRPPLLILALIVAMILVGILVAYFPARRARKINPVDALSRE